MILTTKNLTQKYGDHVAVSDMNLNIAQGSLTALLGPNGAGKSTTMRMLIGLTKPSSGSVTYQAGTKIGVVFQQSVLDAELTVRENLEIRAKQYRHVPANQVNSLIQSLGLKNFENQFYGTLSGGQKRRVDIARALINDPDVLFLDEPTTALDIQTRMAIWDLLHHLQVDRQLTIILTTHYLEEADHADQVYVVDHGTTIASGSARQIKDQYTANRLILAIEPNQQQQSLLTAIQNAGLNGTPTAETEIVVSPIDAQAAIPLLNQMKDQIVDFEYLAGTMDDAFVALTGKEIR
ncbi:ABC transporter ATP-binding protein [Fructobacillus ficulneus]|uniref:ABC transporter domain-containing protein n=1 Tax=Fructobacillus ficulneus TaxID=157463 RepID=A0A0K8MIW0_9LACO|nr:ABC transporter ATP-binding protein [Fructobacillus ficulneus]GAP00492.1 hypothetical protein FFIC_285110 [Fructobacillus ficulneus]